jgi:hypothetical protein
MSSAIWLISYHLNREREDQYLEWFHRVHIPEKLARPGYTWATHYRTASTGGVDDTTHYVALFGGESSAVFYNPSPAQIAPKQTPETRTMMGCRSESRTLILSSEWATTDNDGIGIEGSPVNADSICLTLCDASGNDMDFSAWLVQQHAPSLTGCGMRKLLASSGDARHTIIHTRTADTAPPPTFADAAASEWSSRVSGYLEYPLGRPLISMDRVSL